MKIKAIYKGHTQAQEGVSKQGNSWRKIEAIFQTLDEHPANIAFSCLNSTCEAVLNLTVGKIYDVSFDLSSRTFTDRNNVERWATDAKAWKFEAVEQEQQAPQPAPQQPKQANMFEINDTGKDDLPF